MLTYIPPEKRPESKPTEKPWVLLLLAFVWLWPGIIDHDLWKPHEFELHAAVQSVLYQGQFWAPVVAGQPYVEQPPLYVWVGSLFQSVFSPWLLSEFTAIRLTTVLFMAIGLACAGGAGRHLLGRRHGRSVVLILIGCVGLLLAGHRMDTWAITFAGFALSLYAMTRANDHTALAGFGLALGWVLVFLSSSLSELLLVMLIAISMLVFARWRSRRYMVILAMAAMMAIPMITIWPYALYQSHPEVFQLWWERYAFGGFGGWKYNFLAHEFGYYATVALWYVFPAWPLAVWTFMNRSKVSHRVWQVCGIWLLVGVLWLALMRETYTENALILLLPLAILGAAQLDSLRRGAVAFLNWFGVMLFGMLAIFLWLGFFAMNFGWPTKLAERAAYFSPYYQPDFDYFPMIIAFLFTVLWIWAVTRKHMRGRQAVTNWAAGMTLSWSLLMTLFLPWIDAAKSYRPVVEQFQAALHLNTAARLVSGQDCLYIDAQENRIAWLAWEAYSDVKITMDEQQNCQYRLVVLSQTQQNNLKQWEVVWRGHRPREDYEHFVLLQKQQFEALF
ncbi:hypothetical protein ADP71_04700 [Vitreoscilla sp. C1]|uniref:ArnT family glycosyltransferase n=1 Tax=Vitreoscilla sp. (strain C1) TaxID=96942 RepID=UPI00148EE85F|nr:glycosyltransferase family 39 protein [Vitreoscilla sp. C1]AUZ04256.2 hypothetical protein ADP71_04700 [Vitreoscilla sp. C1]